MKDNVRLHLDLLQTQLARLEGQPDTPPKFAKTAPLLDRLKKKGVSQTADELRAEISKTQRDIVDRKKFHAHTVLKRHLKQFRKVEPLRIAKRAKTASDDAKRGVLDQELKVLDALDLEAACTEIANRTIARRFPDLGLVPEFTRRTLSPAESNVYARFGKTEAVRIALQHLCESIEEMYPQAAKLDSTSSSIKSAAPAADDFHQFENEEEADEADGSPGESLEESPRDDGLDPFFEQSVGIANTDDEDDDSGAEGQRRRIETNYGPTDASGLPVLTQGYISGSEDEFDAHDLPEEMLKPERKNRRGQRARRKIWEQKFGQRANHILKEESDKKRKEDEKEQKRRAREQRERLAKRRRVELDAKPLHPSWEARRKQADAQKEVKFQGTKKTFD